jgi:peptidyl-tRNA hydrolase, PTH1 family
MENYNSDVKDFLVVYDDFNLDVAALRIRMSGSDGGHNGLSSIIYHLNSDQFPRLRIGIGNDYKPGEMADFVLTNFSKDEQKILTDAFKSGEILLKEFIIGGIKGMLDANSRLLKPDSENKKDISNQ